MCPDLCPLLHPSLRGCPASKHEEYSRNRTEGKNDELTDLYILMNDLLNDRCNYNQKD